MREDLLQATEKLLTAIAGQVSAGRVSGAGKIGLRARRIVNKHKVAKHLILDVGDHHLTWHRDQAAIGAEAALDGIYVIRTSVPASDLDAPATVTAHKNLAREERDFRSLKADDLDLRPIHHRLEDRVRGHVLSSPLERGNPVAPPAAPPLGALVPPEKLLVLSGRTSEPRRRRPGCAARGRAYGTARRRSSSPSSRQSTAARRSAGW